MTRKYHSLLEQIEIDGRQVWSIAFGDYDRGCVEDERDGYLDNDVPARKLQIVTTADDQAAVYARLAELNAQSAGHHPVVADKVPYSHHYSSKNHSCEFECPACHRRARQNLNFLGRRVMVCTGKKLAPASARGATPEILKTEQRARTFYVMDGDTCTLAITVDDDRVGDTPDNAAAWRRSFLERLADAVQTKFDGRPVQFKAFDRAAGPVFAPHLRVKS
ncbi:MAG: hypothetical protein VW338_15860 [Rhodospirillaceae bacterium]